MLGKKSGLSYCDVRERYEHFRSRCTQEKPKLFKLKTTRKTKKEKGCTEPLYGKKAKCVIKIVPQNEKCPSFQMDQKCVKTTKITANQNTKREIFKNYRRQHTKKTLGRRQNKRKPNEAT